MSRKKAINLIINELTELTELLNVIADCPDEVPGVLYKLLNEKTDDIAGQIKSLSSANDIATEQLGTQPMAWSVPEETKAKNPVPEDAVETGSDGIAAENVIPAETDIPQTATEQGPAEETTVPVVEIKLDHADDRSVRKEPETNNDEEQFEIIIEPISYKIKAETPAHKTEITAPPVTTIEKAIENLAGATMDDLIQKRLTTDIRRAISLNDRFKFKRELFSGNETLMNSTIEELNKLHSLNEAMVFIDGQFEWNREDETVTEFISIIEKRFS